MGWLQRIVRFLPNWVRHITLESLFLEYYSQAFRISTMVLHVTVYQYIGDFFHLASFCLLVYRLWKTKSTGGTLGYGLAKDATCLPFSSAVRVWRICVRHAGSLPFLHYNYDFNPIGIMWSALFC